jgi:predicted RNase H-like nuclease
MNNHSTTFIGIDMAWRTEKNASGIAFLKGSRESAELINYTAGVYSVSELSQMVLDQCHDNAVIAVDAPLIIKNQSGRRPAEDLISRKYASYHATTHTTNLNLYPQADSVRFAEIMRQAGFTLDVEPVARNRRNGRFLFEVYTHSAMVVLFNLSQIIKYKKGRIADRKRSLQKYQKLLWEKLPKAEPLVTVNDRFSSLVNEEITLLKGKSLKEHEDTLDALLCAYLAFFYWFWGDSKNEGFGDLETGIIINPKSPI